MCCLIFITIGQLYNIEIAETNTLEFTLSYKVSSNSYCLLKL